MEEKTKLLPLSLKFGLINGFILIIIFLIYYLLDWDPNWLSNLLSFLVVALGIYLAMKEYRESNHKLKYGRSLGLGTLVGLFSGVLVAVFTYILFKFIDPGLVDEILMKAEDQMMDQGMTDAQIEQALKYQRMFISPLWMSIMNLFIYIFYGFLISLIIGAIMKKDPENESSTESSVQE